MTRCHPLAPIILLISACASSESAGEHLVPPLVPHREVVFAESDSVFVARPIRVGIDQDGRLFVSDDASGSVFVFSAAGALQRRLGRLGSGPGEFRSPGVTVFLGDTAVAVEDRRLRRLTIFALRTGAVTGTVRFDGVGSGAASGWRDTVWFGVLAPYQDPANLRFTGLGSLARWVVGDTLTRILWDAPAGLVIDGQVSPLSPLASQEIVVDSAGFWVKYGVRDVLERRDREGAIIREWIIPRNARRGVPQEETERIAGSRSRWMSLPPDYAERTFSQDLGLGEVAHGRLALVTFDEAPDDGAGTGVLYVTLLEPLAERACPDIPVPYAGAGRPVITFHADTLVVLSQDVPAGSTEVRLVARYYLPGEVGCPVARPMPGAAPHGGRPSTLGRHMDWPARTTSASPVPD
jgi:hypothetical protein